MNWLGSLQQLGRAVMLPTMVLPAAAILLSLGSLPWSTWGFPMVSDMANAAGHGIFIFAIFICGWCCTGDVESGRSGGTGSISWYGYI